jgi:WD40 repeat protein
MVILDDKGGLWLWFVNSGPETARNITPRDSRGVARIGWMDGRVLAVAGKDGALYTTELPASEKGLMQPWTAAGKVDTAPAALSGMRKADGDLLAINTETDISVRKAGKEINLLSSKEPLMCLQFLAGGTLVGAGAHGLSVWLPDNRNASFPMKEAFKLGICAADVPCFAMVSEQRRSQVQIFRVRLESGKAEQLTSPPMGRGDIECVALSRDGRMVAAGTSAGDMGLLVGTPPSVSAKGHAHDGAIKALAFSVDGKTLYSADEKGMIHVWNVEKWGK